MCNNGFSKSLRLVEYHAAIKRLIGLDTEDVTMCHSVWAEEMMGQHILTFSFFKKYMYISRRAYSKMFTTVILLDYEVASSSSRGMQLL